MNETKVLLAVIDTDLTIRTLKKYPLSSNGKQIHIVSGGENHFMPLITNTSYLEFPYRKKYLLFGAKMYKKIYFAMNKAKKCIDFSANDPVNFPSPEEMKKAIGSLVVAKMGQEQKGVGWYNWAAVIFAILNFFLLLRLAGVIVG